MSIESAEDMVIPLTIPPRVEVDPGWYIQRHPRRFSEADIRQMAYRIQSFLRAGGRPAVQEDVLDYVRALSRNNVGPFIRAWTMLTEGAQGILDADSIAPGLPPREPWRPARGKAAPRPRWEPSKQLCEALATTLGWIPPKVLASSRWLQVIPRRDLRTYIPGDMAAYRLDASRVSGVYRLYPNPTDAQIDALIVLATAAGGRGGGMVLPNEGLSAIEDLQMLAPRTPLVPVRPFGLIAVTPTRLKEAAATAGWVSNG